MASKKNLYSNFYHYTIENGDNIRANTNYYIQAKYSKKQLIEKFKEFVMEDEELTDGFKEFIQTSSNINYRMVYGAYFEASCDIYWDEYIDGYYCGRHYYNTLRQKAFDPILNIFKSYNGESLGMSEDGIDIVSDYNILNNLYDNMVEAERDRLDDGIDWGYDPIQELAIRKIAVHVPILIVGYIFEGQKYFSAIHAVTLQKYIAGKSKFDTNIVKNNENDNVEKQEKIVFQKAGYDDNGERIFIDDEDWAKFYLERFKKIKDKNKYKNLYESAMFGSLEAVKILKKKIRDKSAAYYYAKFLEDSDKSVNEIVDAYEFAIKRKSIYATTKLAQMYKNGEIVTKDLKKAKQLYKKAAEYKSKDLLESFEIDSAKMEYEKIDDEANEVYDFVGFVSPMTGLSSSKKTRK